MPWTALPFGSEIIPELKSKFSVRGIPMFVVLNAATGEVVDADGRSTVMENEASPADALTGKWQV